MCVSKISPQSLPVMTIVDRRRRIEFAGRRVDGRPSGELELSSARSTIRNNATSPGAGAHSPATTRRCRTIRWKRRLSGLKMWVAAWRKPAPPMSMPFAVSSGRHDLRRAERLHGSDGRRDPASAQAGFYRPLRRVRRDRFRCGIVMAWCRRSRGARGSRAMSRLASRI